jgi:cell division protein FtsB
MLNERKAKQAAEEILDRSMDTMRKQSELINSQQTQIETLSRTVQSLKARVRELETPIPSGLGLSDFSKLGGTSLADLGRLIERKLS